MRIEKVATEEVLYEEKQYFARWVYGVSIAVATGGFAPFLLSLKEDPPFDSHIFGFLLYAACGMSTLLLLLNLFHLRTMVSRKEIYVRLGFFLPVLWKRIPCDSITKLQVVTYRPLRDAGGWGYRFGRYDGQRCTFINARGNQGVLIGDRNGRLYIIGSQRPERLFSVLNRVYNNTQY